MHAHCITECRRCHVIIPSMGHTMPCQIHVDIGTSVQKCAKTQTCAKTHKKQGFAKSARRLKKEHMTFSVNAETSAGIDDDVSTLTHIFYIGYTVYLTFSARALGFASAVISDFQSFFRVFA